MQISEMIKVTAVTKETMQNVSGLEKEGPSFEKMLKALSESVQGVKLEAPGDGSKEDVLKEFEELFQSNGSEEDQLLAAMMGQNTLVVLEQLKAGIIESGNPPGIIANGQKNRMAGIESLNNQSVISEKSLLPSQKAASVLNPEQDLDQIDAAIAKMMPKSGQALNVGKNQNSEANMISKNGEVLNVDKNIEKNAEKIFTREVKATSAVKQGSVKGLPEMSSDKTSETKGFEGLKQEALEMNNDMIAINKAEALDLGAINTAPEAAPNEIPLAKQIEGKILDQFDGKTGKVFKMTLNPENLGEIEVELKINHGKLVIGILSASQETHDLLTRQLDQLVRGLALQKIQVETVQIHRFVEESENPQGQPNFSNSNFSQNQSENSKGNQSHFGNMKNIPNMQNGESISETLTQLSSINKQFSRLDYRI